MNKSKFLLNLFIVIFSLTIGLGLNCAEEEPNDDSNQGTSSLILPENLTPLPPIPALPTNSDGYYDGSNQGGSSITSEGDLTPLPIPKLPTPSFTSTEGYHSYGFDGLPLSSDGYTQSLNTLSFTTGSTNDFARYHTVDSMHPTPFNTSGNVSADSDILDSSFDPNSFLAESGPIPAKAVGAGAVSSGSITTVEEKKTSEEKTDTENNSSSILLSVDPEKSKRKRARQAENKGEADDGKEAKIKKKKRKKQDEENIENYEFEAKGKIFNIKKIPDSSYFQCDCSSDQISQKDIDKHYREHLKEGINKKEWKQKQNELAQEAKENAKLLPEFNVSVNGTEVKVVYHKIEDDEDKPTEHKKFKKKSPPTKKGMPKNKDPLPKKVTSRDSLDNFTVIKTIQYGKTGVEEGIKFQCECGYISHSGNRARHLRSHIKSQVRTEECYICKRFSYHKSIGHHEGIDHKLENHLTDKVLFEKADKAYLDKLNELKKAKKLTLLSSVAGAVVRSSISRGASTDSSGSSSSSSSNGSMSSGNSESKEEKILADENVSEEKKMKENNSSSNLVRPTGDKRKSRKAENKEAKTEKKKKQPSISAVEKDNIIKNGNVVNEFELNGEIFHIKTMPGIDFFYCSRCKVFRHGMGNIPRHVRMHLKKQINKINKTDKEWKEEQEKLAFEAKVNAGLLPKYEIPESVDDVKIVYYKIKDQKAIPVKQGDNLNELTVIKIIRCGTGKGKFQCECGFSALNEGIVHHLKTHEKQTGKEPCKDCKRVSYHKGLKSHRTATHTKKSHENIPTRIFEEAQKQYFDKLKKLKKAKNLTLLSSVTGGALTSGTSGTFIGSSGSSSSTSTNGSMSSGHSSILGSSTGSTAIASAAVPVMSTAPNADLIPTGDPNLIPDAASTDLLPDADLTHLQYLQQINLMPYLAHQAMITLPTIIPLKDSQLLKACECNNDSEIRRLVEEGANINVQDSNKNTPLIWMAKHNNLNMIVFLLLNEEANPEIVNDEGKTYKDYLLPHDVEKIDNELHRLSSV